MSEMPAALIAELREPLVPTIHPQAEISSSRVRRGDLRFARAMPGGPIGARLILVLSVDCARDFVEVLLLHTATEVACDVDAVIPRAVSGVPFDVVVQTDLRGVVWTFQLGSAIGRLDDDVLTAFGTGVSDLVGDRPSAVYSGLRLTGPSDPRWDFKRSEGVELRGITSDCTEALLDEGYWIVDPGLLRPDLLNLADDPDALLVDLMHWIDTRSLALRLDEIETLLDLGALNPDAWAAGGELGLDIWSAMQSLVEQSATADEAPSDDAAPWRLVTGTHFETCVRRVGPSFIRYLGRKELEAA